MKLLDPNGTVIKRLLTCMLKLQACRSRIMVHGQSIYLSIGINVRFAAMMADVGDGLL